MFSSSYLPQLRANMAIGGTDKGKSVIDSSSFAARKGKVIF